MRRGGASYHPSEPLLPRTKELFTEGHHGRETGHASRHAYDPKPPTTTYADYWTKFNVGTAFQIDYEAQRTTWFSGLPGLWVQDGACQTGLLLEAGVPVSYSCSEGICGTCETRVLSGVPDHRDGFLTDDERASNATVMICCSGAMSPELVLDL